MYHGRRALRLFLIFGTLGLAALFPQLVRGPAWLAVGLTMLPFGLFELGALLAEDAAPGTGRWRAGARLQLAGGVFYFAALCAGAGSVTPRLRGAPFLIAMAALGLVTVGITWADWLRLRRGGPLGGDDPLAAGARAADANGGARSPRPLWRRLADAVEVIGGTTILLGAISFGFVAFAGAAIARGRRPIPPEIWMAVAFFGGCGLVSVWKGLEHWETYVPGSRRAARARPVVQVLSFILFGGALVALGDRWRTDPGESTVKAVAVMAFGAFCLLGAVAFAWKELRGGGAASGFRFVREGLLERARRATFLYPWDAIASVALGDFHQQTALFVVLAHEGAVTGPADRLRRKSRSLRRSHQWFGAHLIVFGMYAGEPLGDLYRTAAAALEDPAARAALPPAEPPRA